MAKFKNRIKFLLRIILYISIIFFIPIIITALYIIYNEGINSFQRGVSSFLLIILCTLLILIICSQLKYGLIFSLNKLKFPENLVKNNILKNILKILFRIILYNFLIFLSALIIILLIDFSDKNLKIFPLETTQFLIIMAFISILFMLYNDFKKVYNFSSNKIKFLEEFPQKIIEKFKKIKEKILTIKLDFLKNILEKSKKILNSVSDKIENLVELLEDKINYSERYDFKDRCNFFNIRNELEKFVEITYQILIYLTIFFSCFILIPLALIVIYQFLIYFTTLLTTIWEVLIAIIRQIKI
ncbi:hypothetical protein [Fusobacterium animalis]|uniref:hypothetical protein n=1 Tax=Fusobacterium animalis TaxID=76859 RepID=UPI001C6E583E|nr:hypothetical protein [Fusobacterium animalis]QYR62872.1 hypothetical protein JY398_07865 [Fusobacterium animalis]